MMVSYPIILFCYNRPWHTEQVLQALKANSLAASSKLIVFADGPKPTATKEAIDNIKAVRDLLRREQWCGEVELHLAEKNIGCRDSILQGITEVLRKYKAAIILEDDIIVSPNFLDYMEKALTYYEPYKSVFSISAYNLPLNKFRFPIDYPYDVFVSLRVLSWGWGTWADRWLPINWDKLFIPDFLQQAEQTAAFDRSGDDMCRMLREEWEGKSDAWDIQFAFEHFKHHAVSILPRYSYTNNIGLDGSGTHCNFVSGNKNDITLAVTNPKFIDILYEDKRLINLFYNAYCAIKRPLWQKSFNYIFRKIGAKPPFVLKKKIYA